MERRSKRLVPSRAIHPGEILKEELKERGIKQKDFAKSVGMQPSHLSEILKGERNLNEDLAKKLEEQLQIPFSVWMNLHNSYIYDCKVLAERTDAEQEAINFEDRCKQVFNLSLLYKKMGIALRPILERIAMLKERFEFDLSTSFVADLKITGMYKHSEKVQVDEKNMNTWLLLNWLEISNATLPLGYEHGNALKAATYIAQMANAGEITVSRIKDCLNYHGIAYIEVEKLDKAPIDAFSTFRGETPVITVTYRYDDLDKLVFDVLHELCHIHCHISPESASFIAVEGAEYSKDPREIEANRFAQQMLIPDKIWDSIIKVGCRSLSPHAIVRTIANEAQKKGISQTIAVSRYKHETNFYKTPAFKSPKISTNQ